MIQKIRSYLLDNQDNKESLGWWVVIVMLFPIFGIFFQYKKEKSPYLGSVNNKNIEKNIFSIKSFEKMQLIDNLSKIFGGDKMHYFLDILLQGKSLEEYVLDEEINRLFTMYLFEKNISSRIISEYFIVKKMGPLENSKIKNLLGDFFYLLITGGADDLPIKRNIDMNKIDNYCQEVVSTYMMRNIFYAPLSTIEYISLKDMIVGVNKIFFEVYSCDINILKKEANKIIPHCDDHELRYLYESGIKLGKYKNDLLANFSLSVFSMKEDKSINKSDFNDMVEKKYITLTSDLRRDINDFKDILNKNFITKNNYDSFSVIIKENGELDSKKVSLSQNIRDLLSKEILSNKRDFFVFIENGCIYFFELKKISDITYKSFEEARVEVLDQLIEKKIKEKVISDSNVLRYAFEEKSDFVVDLYWNKSEFTFDPEKDTSIQKQNNSSVEKIAYNIIKKKLSNSLLKKGISFIVDYENKFSVYLVKNVISDKNESKENKFRRKFIENVEAMNSIDFYIKSLLKMAKININNKE